MVNDEVAQRSPWSWTSIGYSNLLQSSLNSQIPSGKLTWLLKMAIEIVDLPITSMVIFHSYVNVYQAGYLRWKLTNCHFLLAKTTVSPLII